MTQKTIGIDPAALSALRREYDALPTYPNGQKIRGSIRILMAKHGITRHQLNRFVYANQHTQALRKPPKIDPCE